MCLLLGHNANHHESIDVQCVDIPWTANDGCNDICQCSVTQHAHRTAEHIPMGVEWFGRGVDFTETCSNVHGCNELPLLSMKKSVLIVLRVFQSPNVDLGQFYSPLVPETSPQTEPEKSRKPLVLSVDAATFAYKSTRMQYDGDDDDGQDYVLKAVSCDIKKVCIDFSHKKDGIELY